MKIKLKLNLLPYLLWMTVFVLVPLMLIIAFAFTTPEGTFTFNNIIYATKYSAVFGRSIVFGAIATLICFIIGYPMAYFISKAKIKYQNVFIMLLMIPMWTSFLL